MTLTGFRNHNRLELTNTNAKCVIIQGENGAGKTTILEALSVTSPGRGIRATLLDEMITHHDINTQLTQYDEIRNRLGIGWHVLLQVNAVDNNAESQIIECFYNTKTRKKVIHCLDNMSDVMSAGKRTTRKGIQHIPIIHFAPQMCNLFNDSTTSRRRFFDRIVYNVFPQHAKCYNEYEHHIKTRMNILRDEHTNITSSNKMLSIVEEKLADVSTQITINRFIVMTLLQNILLNLCRKDEIYQHFLMKPLVDCSIYNMLCDSMGNMITKNDVLNTSLIYLQHIINNITTDINNKFKATIAQQFAMSRERDRYSGKSLYGIHRANFTMLNIVKNLDISLCSTGEQKHALLAIIFAQVYMLKHIRSDAATYGGTAGIVPILLLDDITEHLDETRLSMLIGHLTGMEGQIWITSIDRHLPDVIARSLNDINVISL